MAFNKWIGMGNLTRDVELRYTPKGTAIAVFDIAINRSWKTETGEQKEEVVFVPITAFGRTAEVIGQYFKKGGMILVEGRLRLEQWEDKNTHQKRQKLSVILESFSFVGSNGGGERSGGGESGGDSKPRGSGKTAREQSNERVKADNPPADDVPADDDQDVPFLTWNPFGWLGGLLRWA